MEARKREPTYDVFLSSAFQTFMDIRQRVIDDNPGRVWAAEKTHNPDFDQSKGALPFTIVDELIKQIRRSTLFICVLRDLYGTSVFNDNSSVSFLETEIYQAALSHNNVRFYLLEPFNPSDKLKGLLDIVRAVRPGVVPDRAEPESVVRDRIKREIERTPSRRSTPWALSLRKLVGELALRRGLPRPDIEFFDKVFRPVSEKPDRDRVYFLLDSLAGEQSIEKRLTRTWIAIRELCAAPYDEPKFSEYLPLWNNVLGMWSSAAAWYGLHGHLYAGRLAAVNSQLAIRRRMEWRGADHASEHYIQGTKGARASEYFSMAKLMPDQRRKSEYLSLAERDVNDALASIEDDPSGYFSIRGHIRLMQGRPNEALSDFRETLSLKETANDDKAAAEAKADIGLAQMMLGNIREAVRLLREGVRGLESAKSPTFAIRAKKRLAQALLKSGHPFQAWRELNAAHEMAVKYQIYDQITPTMEFANRLTVMLGINDKEFEP